MPRQTKELERRLHIGVPKVFVFEKQRHDFKFAHGVGDSITEIQLRFVTTPLAVFEEGPNRDGSCLRCECNNLDFALAQQFIYVELLVCSFARRENHACLDICGSRDDFTLRSFDPFGEGQSLSFTSNYRNQ
jgi:hypothetical protein